MKREWDGASWGERLTDLVLVSRFLSMRVGSNYVCVCVSWLGFCSLVNRVGFSFLSNSLGACAERKGKDRSN
jgi:hypothetical protein